MDPELAALLDAARRDPGPSARELGAVGLRALARAAARPPGPAMPVEDVSGPVPLRVYRPAPDPGTVVVFLHGGGWTIGDLDSHDRLCRRLAHGTGAAVLAVDHRLAPEHPWPAAVRDTLTALDWALARFDTVAVAGDSSGGNLATLACRHRPGRVAAQFLFYPNTDLTLAQPSVREKGEGWLITADTLDWFVSNWVPDPALRSSPEVSPLYAADLAGSPPALVVTAEHDPLRDEGDRYADRLAAAGVPVVHRCEPGLVHGFLTTVTPDCDAAGDRICADVRAMLGR